MHPLLVAFIVVSCCWEAVTLYLNYRQAAFVTANRNTVPADFIGQVSLADHRRAADYTRARLALSSMHGVLSLAVSIALVTWGLDLFIAAENWRAI